MKVVLSGPIKGIIKSNALWVEIGDGTIAPIVFFDKPKWATNDDTWMKFIRGVSISIGAEGQAALNEMLGSAGLNREVRND